MPLDSGATTGASAGGSTAGSTGARTGANRGISLWAGRATSAAFKVYASFSAGGSRGRSEGTGVWQKTVEAPKVQNRFISPPSLKYHYLQSFIASISSIHTDITFIRVLGYQY